MVSQGGEYGSVGEVSEELLRDVFESEELCGVALVPYAVARRVARPDDVVELHDRYFAVTLERAAEKSFHPSHSLQIHFQNCQTFIMTSRAGPCNLLWTRATSVL